MKKYRKHKILSKARQRTRKFLYLGILGGLLLVSVYAGLSQASTQNNTSKSDKIYFSLSGGFASTENWNALLDLKGELQIRISRHLSAGLGVGYLTQSRHMGFGGHMMKSGINRNYSVIGLEGGQSASLASADYGDGMSISHSDNGDSHHHDFRAVPLTVSVIYGLPVNTNIQAFMFGGGGYYWSSFRDISTQHQGKFGPHVGFGFDFKIADRIQIATEAQYRFVRLNGFENENHSGIMEHMESEGQDGFWHHHDVDDDLHFHDNSENHNHMDDVSQMLRMSLNGLSLRAGLKFSF